MISWQVTVLFCVVLARMTLAKDLLVASTPERLRYFDLANIDNDYGTYIPVEDVSSIGAVAFDPVEGYVYWTDLDLMSIARAQLDGSDESVIISDVESGTSLALDLENRMIYWSDGLTNKIERSNLDGTERTVVVDTTGQPSSLVLTKIEGNLFLFWVDTTISASIVRADLENTTVETLVDDTGVGSRITVDPIRQQIYWADPYYRAFYGSNFDGSNVTKIYDSPVSTVQALSVYGNDLYVADKNQRGIFKFTITDENKEYDLLIFLLREPLNLNSFTTESGQNFMVIHTLGLTSLADIDVKYSTMKFIKLLIGKVFSQMEYEPSENKMYWLYVNNALCRSDIDGSNIETLTEGFFSYSAKLFLNLETREIYFTLYDENDPNSIHKMPMSGGNVTFVLSEDDFIIALTPDIENGYMYYTVQDSVTRRSRLDGTEQVDISQYVPSKMIFDSSTGRLFMHRPVGTIWITDEEGTLIDELELSNEATCFTLHGEYVYWHTDGNIWKMPKDGQYSSLFIPYDSYFTDLKLSQDLCQLISCQNGGSCNNYLQWFTCDCLNGTTGTLCEIDIDECISDPCQNNGTCSDELNGYLCLCLEGYGGDNCEQVGDPCGSNPCRNQGTCIAEDDSYICLCPVGFVGNNCQIGLGFVTLIAVFAGIASFSVFVYRKEARLKRNKGDAASKQQTQGRLLAVTSFSAVGQGPYTMTSFPSVGRDIIYTSY